MNIKVLVFSKEGYNRDTIAGEVIYYNVRGKETRHYTDAELEKMGFDDFDPNGEYIVITLSDGQTSTFRKTYAQAFSVNNEHAENERRRKTAEENRNYCKYIAEECEAYVDGNIRRCPECGEEHRREWDEVGDKFLCPSCGAVTNPDIWDQLSIWDFLDDVFDIEFRVDGKHAEEVRSVRLMVACGGPNIYLNTASRDVELYWGFESASYPLSSAAVAAIDEWANEYWGCM